MTLVPTWPRRLIWLGVVLCLTSAVQADGTCEPAYFTAGDYQKRQLSVSTASSSATLKTSSAIESAPATSTSSLVVISPLINGESANQGQVVCRYTTNTADKVLNYYTCTALADRYGISVDVFFQLNPIVKTDCSNLRRNTDYCVRGFIEPLRAWDRKCGPKNGNATCLGTQFQCCNADTFTCGNSLEDCADGTCYEGACAGETIFTTNGDCGRNHGYKRCAGRWGDCCNSVGRCGTGPDFCSYGECQLGNCSIPELVPMPETMFSMRPFTDTTSAMDLGSSTTSTPLSTTTAVRGTTTTTKPPTTSISGYDSLPSCGKTCFNNMLGQYSALGCAAGDAYCLCNHPDFSNGLRDCSNGACGTSVGSTVISVGSAYCSTAFATHTTTATGFAALASCGQTCFDNMVAQYSALGCSQPNAACLCKNQDFGNGIRDCSNGACGTDAARPVISYGSSYCASATAGH
ncbi:uncharacterized protein B0I36DRAFT_375369 [Microdochium trichocladiopsis]|uniref:CFEM domain-containing protein n=1 Tax=Microdochium trichocladiopsis TaxID=1682393 RepID=A0A9P8Y1T8_9PEZI|nr:uncharacterized protein B0I36DRAFT_375369 [Microdochium trichocladiopsis]KAH7027556.1 hypothetical protein B0I36DRAFT_375369 [Microdochium trichocladiopsis]